MKSIILKRSAVQRVVRLSWGCIALFLAGCGDNAAAIMRDFYNVQNEIIDHMVYVADEESAKKFNALCELRISPKEGALQERKEKMNKQLVTTEDQARFAAEILAMEAGNLKAEVEGIDGRYRQQVHRIRRIIVKLAEQKMEEEKRKDQSFVVSSSKEWPSLANLYTPAKFGADAGGMGGGAPMGAMPGGAMPGGAMPGGAMPGGAMPGGAMPGGAMPGMPGGPGGAGAAVSNLANKNLNFSITGDRIVQPDGTKEWKITRRWKSGGTEVTKLEINGVNLVPMFGDQP
jgi:hypothetical protein